MQFCMDLPLQERSRGAAFTTVEGELQISSKPSVRLVSRWMKNVEGEEDQQANSVVEQSVHSIFEKNQGLVVCPYPVKDIKACIKGAWMQNQLKNHHAVIFILKDDKGLAIDLP
jgi:hypothetical protein